MIQGASVYVCVPYSALNNHVNILALCFHILLSTGLTLGGLKEAKQKFFLYI